MALIGTAWLALAIGPTSARGQALEPVRLHYVAPAGAGCPGQDGIAAGVIGRLGRDPFDAGAPRAIGVAIEPARGGVRARIAWVGGDETGERALPVRATCAELAADVELAIAVAIDPTAAPDGSAPVAASAAAPATWPAPAAYAAYPPIAGVAAVAPFPAAAPRARIAFEVGVLVADGTAPGGAVGLAGMLRRDTGPWSLGVELRADLDGSIDTAHGEVSGGMMAVSGVGCQRRSLLALCGLATVGRLDSHGPGVFNDVSSPFFAVGGRASIGAEVGRLSIAIHADALVTTTRTVLELEGEEVWASSRTPLALGLRMGVRL